VDWRGMGELDNSLQGRLIEDKGTWTTEWKAVTTCAACRIIDATFYWLRLNSVTFPLHK
jgi:hypothetical protein